MSEKKRPDTRTVIAILLKELEHLQQVTQSDEQIITRSLVEACRAALKGEPEGSRN
jgi:hypothetical protein